MTLQLSQIPHKIYNNPKIINEKTITPPSISTDTATAIVSAPERIIAPETMGAYFINRSRESQKGLIGSVCKSGTIAGKKFNESLKEFKVAYNDFLEISKKYEQDNTLAEELKKAKDRFIDSLCNLFPRHQGFDKRKEEIKIQLKEASISASSSIASNAVGFTAGLASLPLGPGASIPIAWASSYTASQVINGAIRYLRNLPQKPLKERGFDGVESMVKSGANSATNLIPVAGPVIAPFAGTAASLTARQVISKKAINSTETGTDTTFWTIVELIQNLF